MTDTHIIEIDQQEQRKPSFFEAGPSLMVAQATEAANVLKDVIEKQKLYATVQGKKHVTVEGWSTLGCMLGILPREVSVSELADGSYEATVELYNIVTGKVIGQGSAVCGVDEKRWGNADRYARRSMAVTRATGKAFRLGLGWIMKMAGYEATPQEEMPEKPFQSKSKDWVYDGSKEQAAKIAGWLEKKNIPMDYWHIIDQRMSGKKISELGKITKEVLAEAKQSQQKE